MSHNNQAKRDFLKLPRPHSDLYSGPYTGPIISTVRRKFTQDCDAVDVPDNQRLLVLHVMFKDEALRFFTDHVATTAASFEDPFLRLQNHFLTPAHRDTYTTEWNTLTFQDVRRKHRSSSTSQLLDLLFQRARDLQSLLDPAYHSPLLFRDCILNSVKSEPFYLPLVTTATPTDPNLLHTRLHQCIRQQETAPGTPSSDKPASSDVFLVEEDDAEVTPISLHYNQDGNSYFKSRIMRGSSSFSTPNYRTQRQYHSPQQRSATSPRPNRFQRRVSFSPMRNSNGPDGKPLLCSFCNSWYHLYRHCPDRPDAHVHFSSGDDDAQTDPTPAPEHLPSLHAAFDRSVDEYSHSASRHDDEPEQPPAHGTPDQELLFLSLVHFSSKEQDNPRHEYSNLETPPLPPRIKDLFRKYPDFKHAKPAPFYGYCLDEGAPQSVTGIPQWIAYLRLYHLPSQLFEIAPLSTHITFGGQGQNKVRVRTLGRIRIRVPLPGHCYFDYVSILIPNDVPMLIGLATQTNLRTVTEKDPQRPAAQFKAIGVTVPLPFRFGHLYYQPDAPHEVLFSTSELAQIHRNLGHAPPGPAYSALRRAYPIETGASDLTKLQEITKSCRGCQLHSKRPNRYRAVLPDQCVFNFDVAVDVMFIRGTPILHAVCRQTHSSPAAIFTKQDSYTIWEAFMSMWVIPYLGVPHNLWVDQAKSFMSMQFKALASSLGCNLVPIAVEAHWSLIAERYHDPLRRIANKLFIEHPAAPLSLIIDYANLAMSHTVGPEGFTPAILAFGAQPRLPVGQYEQQPVTVTNRMDLMNSSRRVFEAIVAQLRLRRALNSASANETLDDATPGEEILVYRENTGWDGPYTFLYREGRLVIVLDDKGHEHTFHTTMIKPYQRLHLPIQDLLNPADQTTQTDTHTNLVEHLQNQNDPRFSSSKQLEYDGIVAKGGVRSVNMSDLPDKPNFDGNRYALCIKDPGTTTERLKARWILQGHQDKHRHNIANDSLMLMKMMLRAIVSFSATFFQCTLWTRDVEQAYMQAKPLQRDVYTIPPPEAKLPPGKVLKIELPHYGLVESSSCFFETYYPVFTRSLHMLSSLFDPCFLFRAENGKVSGLAGLATDKKC